MEIKRQNKGPGICLRTQNHSENIEQFVLGQNRHFHAAELWQSIPYDKEIIHNELHLGE